MKHVLVGCGQITWPRNLSEEQVLAEIAAAGYAGAPASPRPAESAEAALARFQRFGLRPAPGYLGAEFWKPEQRDAILGRAADLARFARIIGCDALYVAPAGFDYVTRSGRTRSQTSGHVTADDGLTDEELRHFGALLNEVGAITLREGVRSCFHNHVGAVIETREEIDRLLALTDPELVFLGPDTGHLAWAGADPVAFCRDYAPRIKTMHLKDINSAVAAQGRAEQWGYAECQQHGIWTELGQGAVDFPAIFEILNTAGFTGWLIVETDVTQLPTALESARVSRAYLASQGL
ncbi:MAG TPA: sugar phosphate isomerase/epimerase [Roseiflexaceae bacterium]|mgnify:CR=1 FL=1|nr:sugar phosphate isomerase/epimerase [Roseiflexaceae bacterium]HMP41772.1 sugar phosphate isomerase/epimerase [Roseiflexaceae bacterium]